MPDADVRFEPVGRTGLQQSGGRIHEEFLPELSGSRKTKIYREMRDNDPVIGALLFAIEMMMRNVDWIVNPADEADEAAIEIADFVASNMGDMEHTWDEMMSWILSFLVHGWSLLEIVYKRRLGHDRDPSKNSKFDDGRIGWRKLEIRAQDSLQHWEFNDDGEAVAFVQAPPPDFRQRVIPMRKALLFRTTGTKNNPEGRSVLRNAYRPWYYKKHIEEIEGIGIERDLAGLPVAHIPAEWTSSAATAEQKTFYQSIKDIIINIRRDEQEGLVVPQLRDADGNEQVRIELMNSAGDRQFDTSAIVERYDQRILMSVLADWILLGHEQVGSFALATSKTGAFSMALNAWLESIAAVFNRHAIPQLLRVNGMDTARSPSLVPGDVDVVSLEELGDYVARLVDAGAMDVDAQLGQFLRDQADIPMATSEGEEAD